MTTTESIFQCEKCLRFVADGRVHVFLAPSSAEWLAFKSADCPQGDCGRDDCGSVAARNAQSDFEKRQLSAKRISAWRNRPREKSAIRKCDERLAASLKRAQDRRDPYKEDEREYSSNVGESVTAKEFGQRDFEESGASEKQDAILIEFFSNPQRHGIMVPMTYLEEISGARRMNNRAITLRRHFEPKGFGIWNEMRPFGATGAMHSHYGIFPLAEVQRMEREREAERERKKLEREGQRSF